MNQLLVKEYRLAMHPTNLLFLILSSMLLIPNYPYYVAFFYTGLAVFFTCLNGRENHDIFYSMCLPIRKKDIVKARFLFVVLLQLLQVFIALPFAFLRQQMNLPGNQVGMDANLAFFGLSFLMLGLFNLIFFGVYYKDVRKVGKAFGLASIAEGIYMTAAEICAHAIPFFRDCLDTSDPQYLPEKLIVLGIGILGYAAATFAAYRKAVVDFEVLDL